MTIWGIIARAASIAATTTFAACSTPSPRLPTYPPMSGANSLEVISDRLESVRSVSSTCGITLTDPAGQSTQLEGVFLAAPPDRFRLRAWKLGHAVLDVTVVGGDVWIKKPERRHDRSGAELDTSLEGARFAEVCSLVGPEFFRSAVEVSPPGSSQTLVVEGPVPGSDQDRITCTVDRRTLTPRRFAGTESASDAFVLLDGYRVIAGVPWPTQIRAAGGPGEIRLHQREVELNIDLPEGAFTPPQNAVRTR
jgi:outer membrane lipoprotein-sorting protein